MKFLGEGRGQGMNRSVWAGAHVMALLLRQGDDAVQTSCALAWELCIDLVCSDLPKDRLEQ